MRQDYSYSQPSSSSASVDLTSLLEAEVQLYADEGESSYNVGEPVHHQPQPEADEGIPILCYCGGEPVIATSYTRRDPGRRYFTCPNVDDGGVHIWKWFDVAVMEEVMEFHTRVRELKNQVKETEQKVVVVEKTLSELSKKSSAVMKLLGCLLVLGLVLAFLLGLAAKASPASKENVFPL